MGSYNDQGGNFEQLEPRLLMSSATAAELFASSQLLEIAPVDNVSIDGQIDTTGDSNSYCFTAPARGRITIEMQSDGEGIDSYLELFNERGRRIRRNNNYSRKSSDSRIRLGVRPGKTYYVRASGAKQTSGNYTLNFTSSARDDYGNNLTTAKSLRLGRRGRKRKGGRIHYSSDVDVLEVVARRTGTMTVNVQTRGRRNEMDCELRAYSSDGGVLDEGSEGEISFDVIEGWTYYIQTSSVGSGTGRYRIGIRTDERVAAVLEPVETIVGSVISKAGGSQLRVVGTDGDDTINLSQSGGAIVLPTSAGVSRFNGLFDGIVVYGFAGQDVIRLDHTISINSWIYGGADNDEIYEAGSGAASLYGQDGDDLLVSVGGGSDRLYGGEGLDSLWFDSTDRAVDVSGTERKIDAAHEIDEFYQPYTDDSSSNSYVSLEIAAQDLIDPQITYYAAGYANFASRPVFVEGAQYDDIAQGAVGDCYYLAALSSLADTDPDIIEQMIAPMGDGTFAVRFYRNHREVYVRLDADLPVNRYGSLAYAKLGADGELWAPLAEKAYAYFRYDSNSYQSIHGGWMADVYREVTNKAASLRWSSGRSDSLYRFLDRSLSDGHAVTAGSYSRSRGPIVGSHAYVVKSVETTDEGRFVTIYNPWGVDGRWWDSNYHDGLLTLSIDRFQQCFFTVVSSCA